MGESELNRDDVVMESDRLRDSDALVEKKKLPDSSEGSTSEIRKDKEIEASCAACCRICLECDGEPGDELISPCMCKGTLQFVHRSCLDHWRALKKGFAFSHCTTCEAQFHLKVEMLEDCSWRKMKFLIFVARDVLLLFLAATATIVSFAYFLGKDGDFITSLDDGLDRILSKLPKFPAPVYFWIAELEIKVFKRIWKRHYHILAMRELTKDFVVEDLSGCYTFPKLDPEHERRLRLLKLL